MEFVNTPPLTFDANHRSKADIRACKTYRQDYEQACDHLRRAERDLAETAAFMAGSLTTVTAVQAVITLARKELELPMDLLQLALLGYVAIFLLILLLGGLRVRNAIRRRTRAEKAIDLAKKGMGEFCPTDPWLKPDNKE